MKYSADTTNQPLMSRGPAVKRGPLNERNAASSAPAELAITPASNHRPCCRTTPDPHE